MHAREVYDQVIEACQSLNIRTIVLTGHIDQLPSSPQVHHCSFAPFQELFPKCAAVVHHGGVGTVAKALAAGIPQLVLPFAFDQMDNATRVQRLGAGDWLKPRKRNTQSIAKALGAVLSSATRVRCEALAAKFGREDGLQKAAELVEELYFRTTQRERT
jgi:UDP:flavonoid glycosyltransferase YjiC (YdhE family)